MWFGDEIQTPNIGALARRSIRATHFYVAPICSPKHSIKSPAMHLTDLVPTLLDFAGAQHLSATDKKLAPLCAKSLAPLLTGKTVAVRMDEDRIGGELFSNRMVRHGDWKLCFIHKTGDGSGTCSTSAPTVARRLTFGMSHRTAWSESRTPPSRRKAIRKISFSTLLSSASIP